MNLFKGHRNALVAGLSNGQLILRYRLSGVDNIRWHQQRRKSRSDFQKSFSGLVIRQGRFLCVDVVQVVDAFSTVVFSQTLTEGRMTRFDYRPHPKLRRVKVICPRKRKCSKNAGKGSVDGGWL